MTESGSHKSCKKCGEVKALTEFYSIGGGKTDSRCKACEVARQRIQRGYKSAKVVYDPETRAAKNREKVKRWKAANRDKERERQRRYLEENRAKVRAKWNKRRADRIRATPPWADLDAIEAIYLESDRLTAETGIEHHVDHIVPLRGKIVCGLHLPWNLRVIRADENLRKSARLVPIEGVSYF